jgi:hypothetical protein
MNSLYILRITRIILAQCLANALNALHDRFVGGGAASPDFFDQQVLADDTRLMASECNQRIHLLRFQMNVFAIAAHNASLGDYREWPEFKSAPQI